MKKVLFIIITSIVLASCQSKAVTEYYRTAIIGEWITVERNGKAVDTDDLYIMEFSKKNSQSFCCGYNYEDHKEWKESSDYRYTILYDIVTIEGKDADGVPIFMIIELTDIRGGYMTYKVIEYRELGKLIRSELGVTYKLRLVKNDVDILGLWEGTEVGAGRENNRWEYLSDGSFKYFYLENGKFVADEDGQYFIYGNLLATNFSNNHEEVSKRIMYENWIITSIKNGVMTWESTNDNQKRTFKMSKVR